MLQTLIIKAKQTLSVVSFRFKIIKLAEIATITRVQRRNCILIIYLSHLIFYIHIYIREV